MAASLVFRLHNRGPKLVKEVLLERGWVEYDKEEREEDDWNLYWRCSAFHNSEYHNLLPWQRFNHHPKTAGITRKDHLARNLRRLRATFGSGLDDFSPTVFVLPNDYTRFLAEYNKLRLTRGLSVYWICKPVDLSRGRGIFIFEDIKDLIYDCSVIIQRYISNPLLISGYKFDLRIYVCVKSFHPLTVYIHQEGLVRFATEKYDLSSLHNLYSHLTNTSINKFGPFYKVKKDRVGRGCKWTLSEFRHFLHSQEVNDLPLWQRINNIVTLTLLTIAPSVPSCPNCVELFGFDVLIDAGFKPWLLEVNYSPALNMDCQADITVKKGVIGDLVDLMNYTMVDSLRERAYQRKQCKQSRFHANCSSHVTPALSKLKEPTPQKQSSVNRSSQTQTFLLLKSLYWPEKVKRRESRQHALVAGSQRTLPPMDLSRIHADKPREINITEANTHKNKSLDSILSSHSRTDESAVNRQRCLGLVARVDASRSPPVSDVTWQGDTEIGADTEVWGGSGVSSLVHRVSPGGLRFRRSPQKLPNIHSCNHKPARISPARTTAPNKHHVPPLRVGDFIRTFPFNEESLRASQHKLEVKKVIQELHKLTAHLVTSDKTLWPKQEEGKKNGDGEEEFDSLLWGLKDPPLLSHVLKPR